MNASVLAVVCGVCLGLLQTGAARPASLHGHVTRAGSDAPVAHARIVIAKVGGTLSDYRTAMTDSAGAFAVEALAPGTYRIHATREGYLQAEFGRQPAGTSGVSVTIYGGQPSGDVKIVMTPTGTITGHVLLDGEPVSRAVVRALRATYVDGDRQLSVAGWTETDDRGEYRLFDLAPGAYFVSATRRRPPYIESDELVTPTIPTSANGNRRTERSPLKPESVTAAAFERKVFPTLYYPGAQTVDSAVPIEATPGAVVGGIDLALGSSPPAHLRGKVILASGMAGVDSVRVRLQPADVAYSLPTAEAAVDRSGAFDVPGVAPGIYDVVVMATNQGSQYSKAVRVHVVDHDPPALSISIGSPVRVTGRVTLDGDRPEPAGRRIAVQLRGGAVRGGCCGAVPIAPDGSFAVDNIVPGEYRLRIISPGRTLWIRSARFGGDDALLLPIVVASQQQGRELEIDLGTRTASVDAFVVDSSQHPQSGVLVIAVPSFERRNQSSAFVSATTDSEGRARIDGIPPGEYEVFASASITAGEWQDPFILQRNEGRGNRVHLKEDEQKRVSLRVRP